jgi:Amiloride-sensitive sodium channel
MIIRLVTACQPVPQFPTNPKLLAQNSICRRFPKIIKKGLTAHNIFLLPNFNQTLFVCRFDYSQFTFYFKENQFITSQRTEAYGMTDFLANCGGILGLCLGVSVISLLEILYFCTIRLYVYLRTDQSTNQTITIFVEELQYFRYKKRRVMKTMKELVADYSSKTTIQGTKYVADSNLTPIERVWWATVVVISIYCCGSLISDMFGRYNETPLIITYANEEMLISEVNMNNF